MDTRLAGCKKSDRCVRIYIVSGTSKAAEGEYLEVYDRQFDGRNRRYYKVTEPRTQLIMYRKEWKEYSGKISELFEGR